MIKHNDASKKLEMKGIAPIFTVGVDVLRTITAYISEYDLGRLGVTCKYFRNFVRTKCNMQWFRWVLVRDYRSYEKGDYHVMIRDFRVMIPPRESPLFYHNPAYEVTHTLLRKCFDTDGHTTYVPETRRLPICECYFSKCGSGVAHECGQIDAKCRNDVEYPDWEKEALSYVPIDEAHQDAYRCLDLGLVYHMLFDGYLKSREIRSDGFIMQYCRCKWLVKHVGVCTTTTHYYLYNITRITRLLAFRSDNTLPSELDPFYDKGKDYMQLFVQNARERGALE